MSSTQRIPVHVVLDDDHRKKLAEVAGRLRDAGMTVEREMPLLGAITGLAEPEHIAKLEAVAGVASVSRARKVFTQDRG